MLLAIRIVWGLLVAVWVIGAFTSKPTARREPLLSRFGLAAIAIVEYYLLLFLARYFGFAYRRFLPDTQTWLWIGLLITIAGVAFAIWARFVLGRNWSGMVTVKQEHELIRTGPYALVRHPIYTGVTTAVVGSAIFDGEIRSLIFILVMLTVLLPKMRTEERFMTEQFGPAYTRYRNTTKALIPFLW